MTGPSDVARLAQELVRFDTVNPPGNEEPAMRHVGGYLQARGLAVEYQRLVPNRTNLIARLPGKDPSGGLIFSGHMDVVHPGSTEWESDPFGGEMSAGRMIGRGAADMKGGVAAMAVAAADLAASGFRPVADLTVAISAGEEVDTVGARLMASSGVLEGAEGIVVGEPTGLNVFVAEKGVLWLRVIAHGRTAHGSMPQLGVNAVSYMTKVINEIESHSFRHRRNPVLGEPTVSVNTIQGGVKTNVVPDRCEFTVDMRLVPGQSREEVLRQVQDLLGTVARDSGLAVATEVEVLQDMPPVETDSQNRLVRVVVEAATKARGSSPSLGGVSYGTDGAILAPTLGSPLVIFGPGAPDQAHQPNEYVEIPELEQAVEAYRLIAQSMLGEVG